MSSSPCPASVWRHPDVLARAQSDLVATGRFTAVAGALNPNGEGRQGSRPPQLAALYRALGPPQSLAVAPPADSPIGVRTYDAYRATAQFVSRDGRTLLYDTSLRAGGPETAAALNAIPAVRSAVASVAHADRRATTTVWPVRPRRSTTWRRSPPMTSPRSSPW